MDTRDFFLVEPFKDVVSTHAPEPNERRGCCGDEEGWEEDDKGEADTGHDEEHGTEEADDEGGYDGEDDDGDGHDGEETEREAGEGDLGSDE